MGLKAETVDTKSRKPQQILVICSCPEVSAVFLSSVQDSHSWALLGGSWASTRGSRASESSRSCVGRKKLKAHTSLQSSNCRRNLKSAG